MQNICNFKFKINYKIILSNTSYSKFSRYITNIKKKIIINTFLYYYFSINFFFFFFPSPVAKESSNL